jgi:putative hydrolase of the HAD superfamily
VTIRAVLFDLDNTLLLEDEATRSAIREVSGLARARGVDPAVLATAAPRIAERLWTASPLFGWADRMGIWWGEGLWGEFVGEAPELGALRAFLPGFRRGVWRGALAAAGMVDDALADRLAGEFRSRRRARQPMDPEAEVVLGDLARDHALALVTNGAPDVQREKLAGTSLARHFRAVAISVEVGVAKPDPRIFELALERIGVVPAEAVMVGDSLRRDIAGARAAGLRAVWIDRHLGDEGGGPLPEPDARIERLSEVRPLLARLDAPAPGGASPRGSRAPRQA